MIYYSRKYLTVSAVKLFSLHELLAGKVIDLAVERTFDYNVLVLKMILLYSCYSERKFENLSLNQIIFILLIIFQCTKINFICFYRVFSL